MDPYISFVIPVYKVEDDFIRECIKSLIDIKSKDVEFIFVDDGTPDNAGNICDEYAQIDKRIRVIHKRNEGVSVARNIGIDEAKGEFISFVDSDDWIESDKMDSIIREVKRSDYDLFIYGQYINTKNKEIRISPFSENKLFSNENEMLELKKMVFIREYGSLKTDVNSGVVCNAADKIIKKRILIENGIRFDPSLQLGEDSIMNLQLIFCCNNALYINICAYHYRMRQSSVCHKLRDLGYGEEIKAFAAAAEHVLADYHADEILTRSLYYRCFTLIFEQFDRAYLSCAGSIHNKIKAFKNEINGYPLARAISIIRVRDFDNKDKIKAILLKLRLYGLFFAIKYMQRRISGDKRKVYY